MNKLNIIPQPVYSKIEEIGTFDVSTLNGYVVEAELNEVVKGYIKSKLNLNLESKEDGNLVFVKKDKFVSEQYHVHVYENQIKIEYNDKNGLFYGLVTLKHLIKQFGNVVPCLVIEDKPKIKVRGVMLDVSRNKVPKLETLLQYVDIFADLKLNQFQLYIEGFSFNYSFVDKCNENDCITGEEIVKLDAYCKANNIDLVPNQNSLGHMDAWLELDAYKYLMDCEDGITIMGRQMPSSTLDATNEDSIKLVRRMTDDLLPYFTSDLYNVGLDEPFELGKGKSKQLVDEIGASTVFSNYVKKVEGIANDYNKKIMMWADFTSKHPETLKQLNTDITLLEWGYDENHPFERRSKDIKAAGFGLYLCCGTSAWTTFTGRTDNMIGNIDNAVNSAIKNNADGVLVTEWGDLGHTQYPYVSLAGFAYCAGKSWNNEADVDLEAYLNDLLQDESGKIGEIILDAGRYNKLEDFDMFNMTLSNLIVSIGLIPKAYLNQIFDGAAVGMAEFLEPEVATVLKERVANKKPFNFDALYSYMDGLQKQLSETNLKCKDSKLIIREISNNIDMAKVGFMLRDVIDDESKSDEEKAIAFKNLYDLSKKVVDEHQVLWCARNKEINKEKSVQPFINICNTIEGMLG